MSKVLIDRDLAERLCERVDRIDRNLGCLCNGCIPDIRADMKAAGLVVGELRAALSAPQEPLTAEECRAMAARCRHVESEKVSLVSDAMRASYSLDILALQLDELEGKHAPAPAWVGQQPAEETTSQRNT